MDIQSVKSVNFHPGRLRRLGRKIIWFFTVYLPPRHDATILTRNGILSFNSKDKTTGRDLHIYRNHEFDDMSQYIDMLSKEGFLDEKGQDVVLDVGGYIGMSSIGFLLDNTFGKAVAFEPSPENFRLLKKNIENNELQHRIFAHNIALSDSDGVLEFELSTKNYGDHRIRKAGEIEAGFFAEQDRQIIQIPAKTLDSLSEQELGVSLDKVRLIWMDVQGHEGKFLKGAQKFLQSHPHVPVVMEFWPYAIKRSGISREAFVSLINDLFEGYYQLNKNGYHYYTVDKIGPLFEQEDHPQKGTTIVLANRLSSKST